MSVLKLRVMEALRGWSGVANCNLSVGPIN